MCGGYLALSVNAMWSVARCLVGGYQKIWPADMRLMTCERHGGFVPTMSQPCLSALLGEINRACVRYSTPLMYDLHQVILVNMLYTEGHL